MSLSNSPLAYTDCYAAMDAALADEMGIRIRMHDFNMAKFFSMRCNNARRIDRKRNAEIYEPTDDRHAASDYDRLVIREPRRINGDWWVYMEKREVIPGEVESLSSGDAVQTSIPARVLKPAVQSDPDPLIDAAIATALENLREREPEPETETETEKPKTEVRRL